MRLVITNHAFQRFFQYNRDLQRTVPTSANAVIAKSYAPKVREAVAHLIAKFIDTTRRDPPEIEKIFKTIKYGEDPGYYYENPENRLLFIIEKGNPDSTLITVSRREKQPWPRDRSGRVARGKSFLSHVGEIYVPYPLIGQESHSESFEVFPGRVIPITFGTSLRKEDQ